MAVNKKDGHFYFCCVIMQAVAKKTKKQKVSADLRRQVVVAEVAPKTNQTPTLYLYPIQFIRKDLTKTLVLCILAISFEIALFLSLEKNLILSIGK